MGWVEGWSNKRAMKCDINGCNNRGINHIYFSDKFIGKYCDSCMTEIRGNYEYTEIKRFPRDGTSEAKVQCMTFQLQEQGIKAVRLKNNGIKVTIDEKEFSRKKNKIIQVMAQASV